MPVLEATVAFHITIGIVRSLGKRKSAGYLAFSLPEGTRLITEMSWMLFETTCKPSYNFDSCEGLRTPRGAVRDTALQSVVFAKP